MKKRIVSSLDGTEVTIWYPETPADWKWLHEMYERGELQIGDSVKGQDGTPQPAAR